MNELFEDFVSREERLGKRTFGESLAIIAFSIACGFALAVIIDYIHA